METETPKRPRAGKTTRVQYTLYLDVLRENKQFRENKFDANQPNLIEETWEKLARALNASGGPVRCVKEWKRVIFKHSVICHCNITYNISGFH